MGFNDDRQMFDVDVDCAKCGKHIDQLPFQPSEGRDVYCADCNRAYHEQKRQNRGERRLYDVDIDCAGCGKKITQLPFQPKGDGDIYCLDCYKKNRG